MFSSLKVLLLGLLIVPLLSDSFSVSALDATEDEIINEEDEPINEAASNENVASEGDGGSDDVSDDDATVEEDESPESDTVASTEEKTSEQEEDEEKTQGIGPSPDAVTVILFSDYPDKQLPAGKPIHTLVGFSNKGEKDFIVETIDASFRYPQDYSYHIQNFSVVALKSVVPAGHESTFQYSFFPHESYGGRPFGLVVMMSYQDSDGNQFAAAVLNETITFQEMDDSFDGEQFFLYLFLAGMALLVIFGLNYAMKGSKRSGSQPKSEAFEQGTQNGDIDYDWLPKETVADFSKASPRRSPRQSPRQRKANRAAAANAEDE